MADSAHLEKMGRELKCPICLSLLNSAVSLTCNHVFCNLCIEKSMKSASNCPVCKIPYRRREVRPAPHMDNLVSIYKSMEVASGVNIFVTQTAPKHEKAQLIGGEIQLEGDMVCGTEENGRTCRETPNTKNLRRFKGKGSKVSSRINRKNYNSNHVRPSFPTKKRVQVPKHSPPDTPTQPAKIEGGIGEQTKDGPEKSSVVLKDKLVLNEKGEPVFSPFFWLREEEDVEKSSQRTNGDHFMDTPPDAPCFSDMKDSDDGVPCNMTAKNGTRIASHDADIFDSEMFDWTQIACSPELFSSPTKIQVEETDENDRTREKESKAAPQDTNKNGENRTGNTESMISQKETDNLDVGSLTLSSPRTKNANNEDGTKISNKRGRKATECTQKKRAKRTMGIDSQKVAEDNAKEKKCDSKDKSLNLKRKTPKGDKKLHIDTNAAETMPKNLSTLSDGAKPRNQGNRDCARRSKTPKLTGANDIIIPDQSKKVSQSHHKSFSAGDKIVSDLGMKARESEIKSIKNPKCDKKQKCLKKVKFSIDDNFKKLVDDIQSIHEKVAAKETRSFGMVHRNSEVRVMDDSSKIEKALPILNGVLRKCETIPNKIRCAFCQAIEDSEASGVMVHYLKGKPVTENYNGGSNVIHAHRNCAEWAPNVYFENDNAINLEAELARSRRMKCCCCGIKGAALGCYEKSCRKSFHVPCAKFTPQCRWDNENFVMLCPLHASCKLPNEISGFQLKHKKKCVPKRQSHTHQPQVAIKNDINTSWLWNSNGSSKKLVLCCSALTSAEKEPISEFERLSGVVVLKNWDSSVTHVIASTDENGACRRTLKFLMGILEGKWILSIEWVKACLNAMEPVDEKNYEIEVDIHGIRDGPRLGRLRLINKQPKLFNDYEFYFIGEYVPSYKGYLHDLVIAAGGTVLHRKPISGDQRDLPSTFIIYSLELPEKCNPSKRNLILNRRRSDAEALASSSGALVATNSWILNSIAACKLQNLAQ